MIVSGEKGNFCSIKNKGSLVKECDPPKNVHNRSNNERTLQSKGWAGRQQEQMQMRYGKMKGNVNMAKNIKKKC